MPAGSVRTPKPTFGQAAESAGIMHAGRISGEDADLEKLRVALGASALLRVGRDPGGVKVTLVRASGSTSKVVASADEAAGAASELLGGKSATPAATPAPATATEPGPLSAGVMTPAKEEESERDLSDPKVLHAAWEERGGVRLSYGIHALVSGLIIPKTGYTSTNPSSGELEAGTATSYGVGAGVGVRLAVMYLPLPQPRTDTGSWAAFRLGIGLDVSGFYVRPPEGYKYKTDVDGNVVSRDTKYANKAYVYGVIPFQLGVHWGFGDFRLPTLWRGLALGIAYSPAVILWLDVDKSQDATEARFNYAGFEVNMDIAKLEADSGSQPQIRLSAMVLPRVKDDLPWLASLGIGVVWY